MKKIILTAVMLFVVAASYAQKPQWACRVAETNDPNKDDYSSAQTLFIPDAFPSQGTSKSSLTYCFGYSFEKANPKKVPEITIKLEYCTPIFAEQVVIVESHKPGSITKVEIEYDNGKSRIVYKGKAASVAAESRLFPVIFPKTPSPVKYVIITSSPGEVDDLNCIDGVALCPSLDPIEIKINLGSDLHFIAPAKALSSKINSEYNEVLPVISPNGKVLYVDRKDHPQNIRNPDDLKEIKDDIYFSKKNDSGEWSEAANNGKPLNNYSHNFVNSISPDGTTLLLANTYKADGSPGGGGASITKRVKGQGWSMPEALVIKEYKNKNPFVSYFMSNNNNVMLMSVEDDETFGEKDVCVSFRQSDGSWSKPMNIGEDVNTIQDEYSPVLASDNRTMYFSSKGHYGYGGYDIFVTKRLDESWKKWSKPINLGPQINNQYSNMGFSIPASGKEVYTYGYSDEKTKYDIFLTQLGEAKSIKPDPVYLISGRVFDAKTKKPIHADIMYEVLSNGKQVGTASSDPDNGDYNIVLPTGSHYAYYAKAKGYIAVHENLEIASGSNYTEFKKDLFLVPMETGQTIALNNVFFEQSKPTLLPNSYPELDHMVEILSLNPKLEIRIDGHTDNQGDAKKNMELSQQRVDVVKDYFVKKGITTKRITTKAFGGTKPIASNAKEETRKLNRRVEFTIVKH